MEVTELDGIQKGERRPHFYHVVCFDRIAERLEDNHNQNCLVCDQNAREQAELDALELAARAKSLAKEVRVISKP